MSHPSFICSESGRGIASPLRKSILLRRVDIALCAHAFDQHLADLRTGELLRQHLAHLLAAEIDVLRLIMRARLRADDLTALLAEEGMLKGQGNNPDLLWREELED